MREVKSDLSLPEVHGSMSVSSSIAATPSSRSMMAETGEEAATEAEKMAGIAAAWAAKTVQTMALAATEGAVAAITVRPGRASRRAAATFTSPGTHSPVEQAERMMVAWG